MKRLVQNNEIPTSLLTNDAYATMKSVTVNVKFKPLVLSHDASLRSVK